MANPGEALLHYRLLERLGRGGGGVVWRALDTRLGREVALKLLPDHLAADPAAFERVRREARALAALDHPNIVTVFSVEQAGEVPFLTMELVRGRTLDAVVPEGGLRLARLIELAVPLADAVAAAHERGLVHRDLKLRNVMVTDEGRLKVLDFGLAELRPPAPTEADSSAPTASGSSPGALVGTFPYMAPEGLTGRSVDARSDIFSLGVILYELATGRRPFQADTVTELVASILRDPVPWPSGRRPDLPPALVHIIERCLEKDPRRRLQSSLDLRDELRELQRSDREPPPPCEGPSVAVLPFADLSREGDQAYFCDGMADEIIGVLARVEGLRVASRTSSFLYRDGGLDAREVGRRLRTSSVLEGSVRKAEDRLRITVRLTDTATGYHLWSERYDRRLSDVFAVQEEIAESVAAALRLTLAASPRSGRPQWPTRDPRAYDYYLRGRQYYFEYRRRGVEFALEMYSHAIEIDPGYARAYAGISDCCAFLYLYAERAEPHRARAEEASLRALELDPGLAEAHASRGLALSLAGRDEDAERAFEAAMRLDPALFEAPYFFARHCFARGQAERAARLFERAAAVEPEDYQPLLLAAQVYDGQGRAEAAVAARRRGLALAEERLRFRPEDVRARYMGANALVALGEREKGLAWSAAARALDPDEPMLLYNLGCIYAMAGEAEEAMACLERAAARGITQKQWYLHDSNLDALRALPRFAALLDGLS